MADRWQDGPNASNHPPLWTPPEALANLQSPLSMMLTTSFSFRPGFTWAGRPSQTLARRRPLCLSSFQNCYSICTTFVCNLWVYSFVSLFHRIIIAFNSHMRMGHMCHVDLQSDWDRKSKTNHSQWSVMEFHALGNRADLVSSPCTSNSSSTLNSFPLSSYLTWHVIYSVLMWWYIK